MSGNDEEYYDDLEYNNNKTKDKGLGFIGIGIPVSGGFGLSAIATDAIKIAHKRVISFFIDYLFSEFEIFYYKIKDTISNRPNFLVK